MRTRIISLIPDWLKPYLRPIYRLATTLRWAVSYKSRSELQAYWRHPTDIDNLPQGYTEGEARSLFLVNLIRQYTNPQSSVLEIGCNIGRNLHYLFKAGFKNLVGIEISEDAVRMGKEIYPEMGNRVRVVNSPAEVALPTFPDNALDVVFTMAVLEHIHPKSKAVFCEMVRITRGYLITIEDEHEISWRHFPRNYRKVFEPLGMKQIQEIRSPADLGLSFVARVFGKQPPKVDVGL